MFVLYISQEMFQVKASQKIIMEVCKRLSINEQTGSVQEIEQKLRLLTRLESFEKQKYMVYDKFDC